MFDGWKKILSKYYENNRNYELKGPFELKFFLAQKTWIYPTMNYDSLVLLIS